MDALGIILILLLLAVLCWLIGKVLLFPYRAIQSFSGRHKSKLPPSQSTTTPTTSIPITTETEPAKSASGGSYERLRIDYLSAYESLRINHSDAFEWIRCEIATMKLAECLYHEERWDEALTCYLEAFYIHLNSPKPDWI